MDRVSSFCTSPFLSIQHVRVFTIKVYEDEQSPSDIDITKPLECTDHDNLSTCLHDSFYSGSGLYDADMVLE
jgi:hypothetical protein